MNQQEHASLDAADGESVLLQGVKVMGDLRGLLFEAVVEQRFSNPSDAGIEVVYTFPLPWGAVLLGVDVLLGDRRLSGAVVAKPQAEDDYEEALSQGNAAIMLEKNHDLSYSLNLGNMGAREDCVITLRYAQTLQFEQRGLRLLVPTVIAPRYGDAVMDGGLQPHQAPGHSLLADYPFAIELRLHGDLARARVASPSHPMGFSHSAPETGGTLTVALARRGSLDRDFVLVIDQLTHDSAGVVARDSVEPGGVVALASFCPRIPAQGVAGIAAKVLVDCSGSMGGDSIEAARRALRAAVGALGNGDRFSLSRFGSTVEHRSRGLWTASDATRAAAQRWVANLQADLGGTQMQGALESTFALGHGAASDVLLVTDGEIGAIDQTIESARALGHRLFVVGIGSSPAESHLRRLADATDGACDFVAPGEAVEPAVTRMFARLRSPRLTDLALVWSGDARARWESPLPASIFDGDTVNIFAVLGQAPAGDVRLLGVCSPGAAAQEIGRVSFTGPTEPADTLCRMAAHRRVESTGPAPADEAAAAATRLAVAYQLVTEQTSFLLVHERAEGEKATDMPALHKVPQMIAAGWGGTGSVLASTVGQMHERPPRAICFALASDMDSFDARRGKNVLYRRAAAGSTGFGFGGDHHAKSDFDSYEIPAFLRKQSDGDDTADAPYRGRTSSYAGLTPMGLCATLRNTAAAKWPKTYADLRRIGLGVGVVDWLELSVAVGSGRTAAEEAVVASFLYAMSRRETCESLITSLGAIRGLAIVGQRLKGIFSGDLAGHHPGVDDALVERILAALADMTADAWPDQVDALASL